MAGFYPGVGFGLTSGVITTLGLMVGLHAGTHSVLAVVGGILTIAVADSLSDALGIHISEEAKPQTSSREVWAATLGAFGTKLFMALTFLVPVLLFDLGTAIVISVVWGLTVLALLSARMAREQGQAAWKVIGEHVGIGAAVVLSTHLIGTWIARVFGSTAP